MAAVEVTISGVLYDKLNRTMQQVVLIGEASLTGLGVGGGPMPPGQGGQPGHPAFPIWGPPGSNFPDKPGYPPVAGHPLPDPPTPPSFTPPGDKPPPENEGGWGYYDGRWGWFPAPSDAQPKGGQQQS